MERKLVDARVDLESAAHFRQIVEAPYPKIKPTLGKCQKISKEMFLAFFSISWEILGTMLVARLKVSLGTRLGASYLFEGKFGGDFLGIFGPGF